MARLSLLLSVALPSIACSSGDLAISSDAGDGGAGRDGAGGDAGAAADGSPGAPDTTPPTVIASFPADGSSGQPTNATLSVDFSEPMAARTLTAASFTLTRGMVSIPGTVSYFDDTATFSPASALDLGTTYTASITTAATDAAGNALAATYTFGFTTAATAPVGPAPVLLGAAGKYAIIAKSEVSNVPTSAITGDVALSPAAASYITGFALTKAGTRWTAPEVIGSLFAADNDPPTPSNLTTAVSNMETAYTDAAGRPTPAFLDLGAGTVGGMTLAPGLYKWTSTVSIPSDVTLAGAPNDTWIFQITGDLKMSSATKMTLSGGARAKNIVWQVAGIVDLGTTSHAEGVILSKTAIKLRTGASINGRLLAQTAVTLAGATVTIPAP